MVALLEAPKKTGKIAKELGYADDKGYGDYKIVKPSLKTLEQIGFIRSIDPDTNVKTPGAPGTTYDLVWGISILREMFKKYPLLVSYFQNNERVISVFVSEQNLFRKHPPDAMEFNEVKQMLSLSHAFFSRYVENENFLGVFSEWWSEVNCNLMADSDITLDQKLGDELEIEEQGMADSDITLDYKPGDEYKLGDELEIEGQGMVVHLNSSPISDILRNAFEHSIITDRMDNRFNPKSLEFLETTRTLGMNRFSAIPR